MTNKIINQILINNSNSSKIMNKVLVHPKLNLSKNHKNHNLVHHLQYKINSMDLVSKK